MITRVLLLGTEEVEVRSASGCCCFPPMYRPEKLHSKALIRLR